MAQAQCTKCNLVKDLDAFEYRTDTNKRRAVLTAACSSCNSSKSDRDLLEFL